MALRFLTGLFDWSHRRRLSQGIEHLERGEFEAAALCFEAELAAARGRAPQGRARVSTHAARARLQLGRARFQAGDYKGAGREFSRGLAADPCLPDLRYWRARVYEHSGRFAEAVVDLERALAGAPDHVEAHLLLAVCLEPLGDTTRAAAVLDRAIELVLAAPVLALPRRASHPRHRTPVDDPELASLAREVAERPSFADRRCRLASRLLESGRLSEALDHLDSALAINPHYLEAGLLAARARLELGETGAAGRILEPLLDRQPDYPDLHFWLGFARFRARTFALAAEALERAAALHRQFVRAHGLLGLAHHALGRREEALRAIRRGLIGERGSAGAPFEPVLGTVAEAAAQWTEERARRAAGRVRGAA